MFFFPIITYLQTVSCTACNVDLQYWGELSESVKMQVELVRFNFAPANWQFVESLIELFLCKAKLYRTQLA